MILIIGGTAAYELDLEAELGPTTRYELDTPYGKAFPVFVLQEQCFTFSPGQRETVAFASRHGVKRLERTPPFVNAMANIWAAQQLGVGAILSWNGVGAINPLLEIHDMVVLDGLLDFTKTRTQRFTAPPTCPFPPPPIRPIPLLCHPFDACLRSALYRAIRATTERVFPVGVYACSEGPRLETAAEIQAFRRMGADVVGMTLIPEVFLAREVGIAYASLAYVTNYATGTEHCSQVPPPRFFGADVARRCLQSIFLAGTALFKSGGAGT